MHSINLAFFFVLFLIYFSILLFLLQLITECPHIVDITPFTVFIAILFIATLLLQLSFIFTQFFFFTIIGVHSLFQVCLFLSRVIFLQSVECLQNLHQCRAAAATKSLLSCLTLCDPVDGSPSGSLIPGILQARILEWVTISFSNAWK